MIRRCFSEEVISIQIKEEGDVSSSKSRDKKSQGRLVCLKTLGQGRLELVQVIEN